MNPNNEKKQIVGECEFCGKENEVLFLQRGKDLMCAGCKADEDKAINSIVQEARKVDSAIELKTDIFNAPTVAFIELQAAINNDEKVPADRKDYALVKEAALRIDKLSAAIFADEQALLAKRNERFAWLKQTKEAVARLRAEEKEQFKHYDINYAPMPTKPTKKVGPKASKKYNYNKAEFVPMAKKYHVRADVVAMTAVQRNISAEAAAKIVAEEPAFRTN